MPLQRGATTCKCQPGRRSAARRGCAPSVGAFCAAGCSVGVVAPTNQLISISQASLAGLAGTAPARALWQHPVLLDPLCLTYLRTPTHNSQNVWLLFAALLLCPCCCCCMQQGRHQRIQQGTGVGSQAGSTLGQQGRSVPGPGPGNRVRTGLHHSHRPTGAGACSTAGCARCSNTGRVAGRHAGRCGSHCCSP